MNLVASGNGEEYTGSSKNEHTFGDGHGFSCPAAGTGHGDSTGYGDIWEDGRSYQDCWEAGGNMSGTADGCGYASYSGYDFEDDYDTKRD